MDAIEVNTHSFIVKVWIEDEEAGAGQTTWRGLITHVNSGERRYIKSMDEISAFIKPYLRKMGVQFEQGWQFWRRFKKP